MSDAKKKRDLWRVLLWALMFLMAAVGAVLLVLLPDRAPMHFNTAGEIDRWGSKYESLLLIAIPVLTGAVCLVIARVCRKRSGAGSQGEKWALITGCCMTAFFDVEMTVLLVQIFRSARAAEAVPVDIWRILFSVLGLMLIPIGNVLPKLRRNRAVGVRTVWSLKNDRNWRRSQVAGGIVFMAAGAVMAAGNLFFVPERHSLWFSIACLLLTVPAGLLATLAVSKDDKEEKL